MFWWDPGHSVLFSQWDPTLPLEATGRKSDNDKLLFQFIITDAVTTLLAIITMFLLLRMECTQILHQAEELWQEQPHHGVPSSAGRWVSVCSAPQSVSPLCSCLTDLTNFKFSLRSHAATCTQLKMKVKTLFHSQHKPESSFKSTLWSQALQSNYKLILISFLTNRGNGFCNLPILCIYLRIFCQVTNKAWHSKIAS